MTGPPGPCGCGCALTLATSYGFEAFDFSVEVLHRPMDDWQRWLAIHAGELLPNGTPRFRFVLVLVARQNGKTELLVMLTDYWIFGQQVGLVLGTSTKLEYAKESWEKALKFAESTDLALYIPRNGVRRTNGEQELVTVDGCRYKIAASNEEGGRSLTIDRAVLDEFRQHHDYSAHDAVVPATNARPDAQVWAISNMGDARSEPLLEYRESAIEYIETGVGNHRLGLFEWSAFSRPGVLPDPTELGNLAAANPNMNHPDGRNPADVLLGQAAHAKRKGGKVLAGFLTECLCVYVPKIDPAIDPAAWSECLDVGPIPDELRRYAALCLDVSMDGFHATLCAAVVLGDGRSRVEVVAAWSGPQATRELRRDLRGKIAQVRPRVAGWLPGGPAASVGADLVTPPGKRQPRVPLPARTRIEEIRGEVPMICMGFEELVRSRQIAQSDDPLLNLHVAGAERLWQGDQWRFVRKGAGHCDAVYAAAGAVHLARTYPMPVDPSAGRRPRSERLAEGAE